MYFKNTPAAVLARTLAGHLVYDAAAAVHFARVGLFRPFARAKIAAIAGAPQILRKRAAVQRTRRVGANVIWNQLERRWIATKRREKQFDAGLVESAR
jgi:hypothetical protein